MGGAMLRGWLALGFPPAQIHVIDPQLAPDVAALCAEKGVQIGSPSQVPAVVVLAVKPQMLDAGAEAAAPHIGTDTLVLSIIAGKTIANILERLPRAGAVVRAMPNTPAAIGRGITGAVANLAVTQSQQAAADALLAATGRAVWLESECLIDAVTAVSGSGPAYVFYLAECLAKAGESVGLPPDIAAALARATVEGAGELLFQAAATGAAELRRNVTSPGGTTEAALKVLMSEEGLQPLLDKAVAAATRRAGELSG
jgi:pyrroline-5-carboxylate reductase